jgi:hypothetical protein
MSTNKGQALIELVIGFGILAIVLSAVTLLLISSRETKQRSANILSAESASFLQSEALRSVREASWGNLSVNGIYHVEETGTSWSLVAGSEDVSGFTRQLIIDETCRENRDIVDCPSGTVDPSTKKVTSKVTWSSFFGGSVENTFYLTRYLNNSTLIQTTQAEFDQGTLVNTESTITDDGEIQLISGGDWATPQIVDTYNAPGSTDASDVFIQGGFAYLVRPSSTQDEFIVLNINNPRDVQFVGSVDLDANGYSVFASGDYAYVATSHNSRELTVVDISDENNPTIVGGGFDTPGVQNGRGIYVVGDTAYLATQGGPSADFFVLDINDPFSISQYDSINLDATGFDIQVLGDYAYVATSGNTQELQVIDVSNPNNISPVGSYNTPGGADGQSIFVEGTTVYLTTNDSSDEFYILNASNLANIIQVGATGLGGHGLGVFVQGELAFVTSNAGDNEFQVVDISTPSSPIIIGTADLNGTGNGLVVLGDYAYLTSKNNSAEFQVIFGGDGSNFVTSGKFESATLDSGSNVGFNFLTWTETVPAGTDIQFQIATSNTDGPWTNFVGPDGSGGSFYDSAGAIPLNSVSARYFRFKATLSGDGNDTPILEDITVNYSP